MNRIEADHRRIVGALVWLLVIVGCTAAALAAVGFIMAEADDAAHRSIESYHLRTLNLTRKLNHDLDLLEAAIEHGQPTVLGNLMTVRGRITEIVEIQAEAGEPGQRDVVERLRARFERLAASTETSSLPALQLLRSVRLAADQLEKLHIVRSNDLIRTIELGSPQRLATLALTAIAILIVGCALFAFMYRSLKATLQSQLEAETSLQVAQQRLRDAEKLQALGQLVGGIAHDFNNLLTVINGHMELMSRDQRLPPGVKESLSDALTACSRASQLTRQLLAFARRQPIERRAEELNALVTSTQSMLETLIQDDVTMVVELDPARLVVEADAGQLQQVLTNLILNARDAVARGGRVHLATCARTVGADDDIGDVPPGRYCVVSVADDGPGMDAETLSRAFEPFFTTKERGEGTGLGLSTVHGIISKHGGHIRVSSEVDRGTRFDIYLPQMDMESATQAVPGQPTSSTRGSETILLIEDEPEIRKLTQGLLTRLGYTVHTATHGREAVAISASHPGSFDLIVSDVIMPGMTGPEAVERILPIQPDATVIYMSGYTDDVVLGSGVSSSRAILLEKPFKIEDLARLIRAALDDRISDVA